MGTRTLARWGAPLAVLALCALARPASAHVFVDLDVAPRRDGPFTERVQVSPGQKVFFHVAILNRFAMPLVAVLDIPELRLRVQQIQEIQEIVLVSRIQEVRVKERLVRSRVKEVFFPVREVRVRKSLAPFRVQEVLFPGQVERLTLAAICPHPGTFQVTAFVLFVEPLTGVRSEVANTAVVVCEAKTSGGSKGGGQTQQGGKKGTAGGQGTPGGMGGMAEAEFVLE